MADTTEKLYYIKGYSERSDAVIGFCDREATRPFKAQLSRLGGKFNSSLRDDRSNERVPGWVFSSKSAGENNLEEFVQKVNSGEIEGDSSGDDVGSGRRLHYDPSSSASSSSASSSSASSRSFVSSSRKKIIPIRKDPVPAVQQEKRSVDIKITPEDFQAIRKKTKNSVMTCFNSNPGDIAPGYSFNLLEYDTNDQDEDNLIRLRKSAKMVILSTDKSMIDTIIRDTTAVSLDVTEDGSFWVVLYF